MRALDEFTEWLATYVYPDTHGRLPEGLHLNYHARSDAHSVRLMELIVEDLLDSCAIIRDQAGQGKIAYGINYAFIWPNGKRKTLDLVIGIPVVKIEPSGSRIRQLRYRGGTLRPRVEETEQFARILIACEAKAIMTEHRKSQPRVFDELNGSHAIVHAGSRDTIAAGITVVNISDTFVSALRQRRGQPVEITVQTQPLDAAAMVEHLRGLPVRDSLDAVGFDAYCTFVMNVDNQGRVALWTEPPAPQPGERDAYDTFLSRICRIYAQRIGDLSRVPAASGVSVEEALAALERQYPGLLDAAGRFVVEAGHPGAPELQAILRAIAAQ